MFYFYIFILLIFNETELSFTLREYLYFNSLFISVAGKAEALVVSSPIGPIATSGTPTRNQAIDTDKNTVSHLSYILFYYTWLHGHG